MPTHLEHVNQGITGSRRSEWIIYALLGGAGLVSLLMGEPGLIIAGIMVVLMVGFYVAARRHETNRRKFAIESDAFEAKSEAERAANRGARRQARWGSSPSS